MKVRMKATIPGSFNPRHFEVFEAGKEYDFPVHDGGLAEVFFAEGWAEPVRSERLEELREKKTMEPNQVVPAADTKAKAGAQDKMLRGPGKDKASK